MLAAEISVESPTSGSSSGWSTLPSQSLSGRARRVAEPGGRRRQLPAPRTDGQPRRRRHPGADPARRRQAKRRSAVLAWRPLRVHAQSARDRTGRAALQKTLTDGRAGLRPHQAQPRHEQVSPTRQIRSAHRMAPDHGHPHLTKLHNHTLAAATAVNRGQRPAPPYRNRPAPRRSRLRVGFRDSLRHMRASPLACQRRPLRTSRRRAG